MFVIAGIVIVLGAVIGGYLLEKGNLIVLFQPAELVIIGGAALGTLLIANPLQVIIKVFKGVLATLAPSKYSKKLYLDTLRMFNELFSTARKAGVAKIESDVEEPTKSQIFSKYPWFLKDHEARDFVCDTLRLSITGVGSPFELDQMMELDMEVHHHEASTPVAALSTVADSLPGLGIVAAVLGVVITMGAMGGPPEEIGHKVAAALVGTFLGILLCYGFIGPVASNMSKTNDARARYFHCLRVALVSFMKGLTPIIAIEFARRSIPHEARPTFMEMETHCKGAPKG
jgi:chemotaxis protein MotA